MAMTDDHEDRLRALWSLVAKLGQRVIDQGEEIERLKGELSMVQTERAIASLAGQSGVGLRSVGTASPRR